MCILWMLMKVLPRRLVEHLRDGPVCGTAEEPGPCAANRMANTAARSTVPPNGRSCSASHSSAPAESRLNLWGLPTSPDGTLPFSVGRVGVASPSSHGHRSMCPRNAGLSGGTSDRTKGDAVRG